MSTYSSKPHTASASAGTVYSRINNLGSLQERIDALPEDIRSKLGEVTFTDDTIVINAGPVGAITFTWWSASSRRAWHWKPKTAPCPCVSASISRRKTLSTPTS